MEDLHRNLFKLVVPFVIGGYLSGLVVALLWYHWHPTLRETDVDQLWWLIVCIALLLIILIFSRPVRCILLLTLPSLTSSRGRALLIALAFFLAATGPSANILANVMVMLRSLACSQELLRQMLSQMLDVLLEPVQALRTAFTFMMEEVRRVLRQLTLLLLRIQSYMLIIINTLKSCAAWLKSVVELCNSQLGTPWMRCQRAAETAMLRCRSELGMLKSLCYATKLFLALCYPTKLVDIFCSGFWDPKWELMDPILKRYLEFVATLEQMFDASITFEHEFFFHNNPSKNLSDVGEQIAQDINQDLAPFLRLHSWTHLLCCCCCWAFLSRPSIFYLRYMLSRAYQNVYITSDFYAIDEENWRLNRDTVLPLEYLERFKYLKLSSLRLTQFESLLIAKNSFFMLITCLQLGCICFVDYSLFWLLATISYYGHEQAELEVPAYIDLHIKGGGIVGDIMRGIVNAFRPLTQSSKMDTRLCLPLPNPPRYNHYVEILSLCLLAWIVALTEPYVLRLRHVIMRWIYPERAQERAMYFYEHLFIERDSVFIFNRRKARAAFKHRNTESSNSCPNWLRAKLATCNCCACLLPQPPRSKCILCQRPLPNESRIYCQKLNCPGVYCEVCFTKCESKCCLCQHPREYGDFEDPSEVDDSSDDGANNSYGQLEARIYGHFCTQRTIKLKKEKKIIMNPETVYKERI